MTIKDALYSNLNRLLTNLSIDSENITAYSESLRNLEKEQTLADFAEKIETQLIKEVKAAEEESKLMIVESHHLNLIREYRMNFNKYPNARFDEILLILSLIRSLTTIAQEELDFEAEFDGSIYSLIDFDNEKFGTNVFHYTDPDQANNNFVFFNFDEIEEIINYFQNPDIAIASEQVIHLISNIGKENQVLASKYYALLFHGTAVNKTKSKAYIAITLIINGKIFHNPYEYSKNISLDSLRSLSVTYNYHQFKDILTILSEYISQNDILDKFLRLYHVIENFMFKFPLVNLERNQNGKPFSFRDFQRIYTNISRSEVESLKRLMQKVFPMNQKTGVTFKTYIFSRLTNIIRSQALITEDNFNNLISYLNLEKKRNGDDYKLEDIAANNIDKIYAGILYATRCSIVHNKESEFHLTHDILFNHGVIGDTTKVLLEEFLIPTIEEIIVFLLTENENNIVWFSNSTLMLWENTVN